MTVWTAHLVPPFAVIRRPLIAGLALWLTGRAFFVFAAQVLMRTGGGWLPQESASVFLVVAILIALRIDLWRARETILIRNLGFNPWIPLVVPGLTVIVLEWTARTLAVSFGL